jgi:predicted deacylase
MKNILIPIFLGLCLINIYGLYQHKKTVEPEFQDVKNEILEVPDIKKEEQKPNITVSIPSRAISLDEIYKMVDQWHAEAPEITEVGEVGKSHENHPIKYIRIGKKTGPKVLIMATIHGNEKLCTMTSLGCINEILKNYMSDSRVTDLLKTRDIYYVPVVSPEGYINNSRHVLNLDPNRNWNGPDMTDNPDSIAAVKAMKSFYDLHKFNAVMSCHNYGKLYFYPWGYTRKNVPNVEDYKRVLSEMGALAGYTYYQLHGRTAPPRWGYEVDYFHSKGAFAIVNEIGDRFEVYDEELQREISSNYKAFLVFIDKAPLINPAFYTIIE